MFSRLWITTKTHTNLFPSCCDSLLWCKGVYGWEAHLSSRTGHMITSCQEFCIETTERVTIALTRVNGQIMAFAVGTLAALHPAAPELWHLWPSMPRYSGAEAHCSAALALALLVLWRRKLFTWELSRYHIRKVRSKGSGVSYLVQVL